MNFAASVVALISHRIQVDRPIGNAIVGEHLSNGSGKLTPLQCKHDDRLFLIGRYRFEKRSSVGFDDQGSFWL
jgi:hypothetical protein